MRFYWGLEVTRGISYWTPLVLAFIFASFLTFLPIDAFYDRANYLIYAQDSINIFYRYFDRGLIHAFSNEPLWLGINILLSSFFSPENTLRFIIFASSFIASFLVIKNNSKYFFLVVAILILPQVIKNDIVHLRQGLAVAVFLIGWYSSNKKVKLVFIGASAFVHASFFFVDFILFVTWFLRYLRLSTGLRAVVVAAMGFVLSAGLIFITAKLGARQAVEYSDVSASVSGLAFIFWGAILFLYLSEGIKFSQEKAFEISALVFYLSTYFFMPVTARIFESATLLVLLAGMYLTKWRRWAFLGAFIFYFVFSYLPRLSQPMLGWEHSGF